MNFLCFSSCNSIYSIKKPISSTISMPQVNFFGKNVSQFCFKDKIIFNKFLVKSRKKYQKNWYAVFGPGGGLFGVGTSELVVIGIVAWLVLGPKRLYQLARDIGKISGEIKNVAEEAKQTFKQAIDLENINENSEDKKSVAANPNKNESTGNKLVKKSSISELDQFMKTDLITNEKKKSD
jgi:Tat protein translocase TatB subunit